MSYTYHLVFKKIQQQISTPVLIALQLAQIIMYTAIVFSIPNIIETLQYGYRYLINFGIILLILRGVYLYSKYKIYSLTPTIENDFDKADRQLLIKEIEESLKKYVDFAKWSCGILATVLALVTNIFVTIFIKSIDDIVSPLQKQAIINELSQATQNIGDIFIVFFVLVICILGIVLLYYFILQLLTYNQRLVLKVLKNCEYSIKYDIDSLSWWKKTLFFINELFFLDYLKKIL